MKHIVRTVGELKEALVGVSDEAIVYSEHVRDGYLSPIRVEVSYQTVDVSPAHSSEFDDAQEYHW